MKRRDLLTAAIAAPALAAVPAVAMAAETPVMALFREWTEAKAAEEAAYDAYQDTKACDALTAAMTEKMLQLLRTPGQTAQDFVCKVVAWTNYGMFELDDADERTAPIWAEARALVGEA